MNARDDYPNVAARERFDIAQGWSEAHQFTDALAELDRLRAEVERMRPVIEAAEEWFDEDDYLESVSDWLAAAVANYRNAVAALDAGEPAGE